MANGNEKLLFMYVVYDIHVDPHGSSTVGINSICFVQCVGDIFRTITITSSLALARTRFMQSQSRPTQKILLLSLSILSLPSICC